MLLWEKGDMNAAVTEVLKYMNMYSSFGPKQMYLIISKFSIIYSFRINFSEQIFF